jgi:hypothetical protein
VHRCWRKNGQVLSSGTRRKLKAGPIFRFEWMEESWMDDLVRREK